MFKDYYSILEVVETANQDEIKSAFKKQALRWHPDRNHGKDTTQFMQEINEAYLILKDKEARDRYNKEYQRFKEYNKNKNKDQESRKQTYRNQHQEREKNEEQNYQKTEYSDFKIKDDILNKWMENAKRQAVALAKQTIEDLRGMVVVGTKAAVKEGSGYLIWIIMLNVIVFVIILIAKALRSS